METKINSNELEQMRSQYDTLKRKLDSQKIVDDQIIRSAMKQKMSWIHRYVWLQLVVLFPLVCLLWLALVPSFHLSWAFYVFMVLTMGVSSVFDFLINKMSDSDWKHENLVETGKKLARMNRLRIKEIWTSTLMILVFITWFFMEIWDMSEDRGEVAVVATGAAIGAIVGLIIEYRLFSKMQRTNREIIRQIKEITTDTDQETNV